MTTDYGMYQHNPAARERINHWFKKAEREAFGGVYTTMLEGMGYDGDRTPADTGMEMEPLNQNN